MDSFLENTIFKVVDPPRIKLSIPSYIRLLKPMETFLCVMIIYFIMTAGTVFNILNDIPSIGSAPDGKGGYKPVVIMPNRLNAQYGFEGMLASFMYIIGAGGFILLDKFHEAKNTRTKIILGSAGASSMVISFLALRSFMFMKMPSYMH
ncbi:Oligosaccharyltransferase complex subunit OSTC [Strongyloides ratti]|uniref:Oligosaccharyltransferase complex subunit n=1 Tax=Strongyloides ratti TaxID=34506 RepID=A0A090LC77_STRRB|nr:Oligosaccharyltransferase complex subunit OSTC [Strongyloides ratti]CEF67406.1 Oligosaccharyltransferase complex subunit OSTC [Strongyloides ratti]